MTYFSIEMGLFWAIHSGKIVMVLLKSLIMSKKKYLQAAMPTELHQRLKACAALAGIPMGHLVCFLVEELTKGVIDKEDSLISVDEVLAKAKYYSPNPAPEIDADS